MTTNELIAYYAKLLILQYRGKPKAYATIESLVKPVIMDQLPIDVQNAFNIDTAEGVQLDTLGIYVGVQRSGNGFNGPITLDDDDFRQLIKFAVIQNSSGSSLADIQNNLHLFFGDLIQVFDYANMRMSYFMDIDIGSYNLAQMVIVEGLLPVPMAVQLASVIYAGDITGFFGMRSYELPPSPNISPFNTYEDYQLDWPWLDYYDALIPVGSMLTQDGDVIVQEDDDLLFL